ncbi:uncharacterized protein BDW43DRAFT_307195 [Aspergillus alliaceus]|uniref:uncharacterized protein n=1 Tax=Petromyces alliaceus TaxID=209559 RepID=UPI0012A556D1|nr:uncharacterized protein BDW43DRAFT_307195 [Aspergillus alliaceus]KAB8237678.1 hypothetical protein BDW43DRAFT_307195 [Aspergillus alliaceus]
MSEDQELELRGKSFFELIPGETQSSISAHGVGGDQLFLLEGTNVILIKKQAALQSTTAEFKTSPRAAALLEDSLSALAAPTTVHFNEENWVDTVCEELTLQRSL